MHLTYSNTSLAKLDTLGQDFDTDLHTAKNAIHKENCDIQHLKDNIKSGHSCSAECSKGCEQATVRSETQKKLKQRTADRHLGFSIAFDNIDMEIKEKKNMTMANQNKDVHWVNHHMIMNRVSGNYCSNEGQKDLSTISNLKFLPSHNDVNKQRFNYIILISRIIVQHFDTFHPLKDVCIYHIPHAYGVEMCGKSTKVCFSTFHLCHHSGVILFLQTILSNIRRNRLRNYNTTI